MGKAAYFLLAALLVMCSGCAWSTEEKIIELKTKYSGAELDLCASELRDYLNEDDFSAQCNFLLEHEGEYYDWQNIMLMWNDCGSREYTVYISESSTFSDAYIYETEDCEYYYGLFRPGKTYYWKVEGSDGAKSETDSFTVKDMPVAIYTIEGAANVRDIGGWTTEDGRRVRYGMLYRGSQLNGYGEGDPITEYGKQQLREMLSINSEIDLRAAGVDDGGQTENFFNPDGGYLKAAFHPYTHIIPEYGKEDPDRYFDDRVPEAFRSIFEFLSEEDNYPVYYHCNAGADRAGTLSFMINGLLGVSYENLTKDFEITSFMGMGNRWRGSAESNFTDGIMSDTYNETYVAWGKMYELMMQYYSTEEGTLSSAIENYLIKVCGVSADTLDSVKSIMLEY